MALIAHYPHMIGTGTVLYDYSGNGHNATITGALWKKNTNGGGYNLDYDGTNDKAVTAASNDFKLPVFSVTFWTKPDVLENGVAFVTAFQRLVSNQIYGWAIQLTAAGQISVAAYNGDDANFNYGTTSAILTVDKWYFVTATFDTEWKVYVNCGDNIYTQTAADMTTPSYQTNTTLKLGHTVTSGDVDSGWINAEIDDVRLFDTKISREQEKQIYNKTYRI